jgi:acyl-CoA synthetase (AMP-forming)/AMP-acid ligase II
VRTAHFLRRRLGRIDEDRPGHVAMMLENHFELLSLFGGCGYAGLTGSASVPTDGSTSRAAPCTMSSCAARAISRRTRPTRSSASNRDLRGFQATKESRSFLI